MQLLRHLRSDRRRMLVTDFHSIKLVKSVPIVELRIFKVESERLELTTQEFGRLRHNIFLASTEQQLADPSAQHKILYNKSLSFKLIKIEWNQRNSSIRLHCHGDNRNVVRALSQDRIYEEGLD